MERHHDSGRTEAALRAVVIDERLLDRMQRPFAQQAFDGQNLTAVERREGADASVDRPIIDASRHRSTDRDRASAAVAFGAALFHAGAALRQAQPIEQRRRWLETCQFVKLVVQQESNRAAHENLLPEPIKFHASCHQAAESVQICSRMIDTVSSL